MNKIESKTPIFNNKTCPEGLKKEHAVAEGYYAQLIVTKGMLEFVWDDSGEKIIVDGTKPLTIKHSEKHHLNLLWEVEFYVQFIKE